MIAAKKGGCVLPLLLFCTLVVIGSTSSAQKGEAQMIPAGVHETKGLQYQLEQQQQHQSPENIAKLHRDHTIQRAWTSQQQHVFVPSPPSSDIEHSESSDSSYSRSLSNSKEDKNHRSKAAERAAEGHSAQHNGGCHCYDELSADQQAYLLDGGYRLQCNPRCLAKAPRSMHDTILCDPFSNGNIKCLMCQITGCDLEKFARDECVPCDDADVDVLLEKVTVFSGREAQNKRRSHHRRQMFANNGGVVNGPAAPLHEKKEANAALAASGGKRRELGSSGGNAVVKSVISSLDAAMPVSATQKALPSFDKDYTYGLGEQYGSFPSKSGNVPCPGGTSVGCDEGGVQCGPGTDDADCDGYYACNTVEAYQICDCDDSDSDIGYVMSDVYCQWFTSLQSDYRSTFYSRVCLQGENRNAWCQACFDDVVSTYPALSTQAVNCDIVGVNH